METVTFLFWILVALIFVSLPLITPIVSSLSAMSQGRTEEVML